MIAESVKFRGHGCFKNEWAGFDTIKPINVIIGRNNTGKSHLLDFVSGLCGPNINQVGRHLKCKEILDEQSLKQYFREGVANGPLPGSQPKANWSIYFG
jgi:AAA15 family ATPase/GTPase